MERKVGETYLRACDKPLAERLCALPEYRAARTVLLFVGVGTEPDTLPIIEQALVEGKTVALPRVLGHGIMRAHKIGSLSELVPGAFGIQEPAEESPVIPPSDIDLILVPGLAFARDGHRLGHGGGYYDRYLAACSAFTVGLAREKLLLAAVPAEPHDIPVRCLITEENETRPLPGPRVACSIPHDP